MKRIATSVAIHSAPYHFSGDQLHFDSVEPELVLPGFYDPQTDTMLVLDLCEDFDEVELKDWFEAWEDEGLLFLASVSSFRWCDLSGATTGPGQAGRRRNARGAHCLHDNRPGAAGLGNPDAGARNRAGRKAGGFSQAARVGADGVFDWKRFVEMEDTARGPQTQVELSNGEYERAKQRGSDFILALVSGLESGQKDEVRLIFDPANSATVRPANGVKLVSLLEAPAVYIGEQAADDELS